MIYTLAKPLPHIDNILWLAKVAGPFPVNAAVVLDRAKFWGFSQSTQDFLALFPKDQEFESRADFLTRCDDLDFLMHEERDTPKEALRSPQG